MYIKLCKIICVECVLFFFLLLSMLTHTWLELLLAPCYFGSPMTSLSFFFNEMEHVRLYRIGGSQTWVLDFELDCSNDIFIFSP